MGFVFGILESGGNMGFSGSFCSEGLFGGSDIVGIGFLFGGRMFFN